MVALLAVLSLVASVGCSSAASSYPSKDINLIVPWGAGGNTDLIARALTDASEQFIGKKFVVKNVEGGSGTMGSAEIAQAKPDGYNLLLVTAGPFVTVPHLTSVPYKATDAFDGILQIGMTSIIVTVKGDSPYKTLKDLIEAGKAKPGTITYGTSGEGTTNHLSMVKTEKETGAKFKHVPYKNTAESTTAVLGGHIDVSIAEPVPIAQALTEGRLRAIAIFEAERFKLLPDVPTAKEQGYDVVVAGWNGVAAPKGTPSDVITKLHDAFKKGWEAQSFKDVVIKLKYNSLYTDGKAFEQRWAKEYDMFGTLMKEAGLKK